MRGKGCALQGSLFQTRGGIGGLATNEKAMKARGCVRGRERDGPRSDRNIRQAETRKRRTSQVTTEQTLRGVCHEYSHRSNIHAGNELDVAEEPRKALQFYSFA
jgi:hypothetical protein